MSIRKIVFVCSGHDEGLQRWALRYLCEAVRKEGVPFSFVIDLSKTNDTHDADDADVVLVYRSFDLKALHFMRKMRYEGKFVMFFLDDYLFQPNCKYTHKWKMPMEPLHEADCLVSSSAKLLSKMPEKPKILRRSVMDYESVGLLTQEYRRSKTNFDIGWLGSLGRLGMMDRFVYDMLRIMDAWVPEDIKCTFHCFGSRNYPQFSKVAVKEHLYIKPGEWRTLYAKWVAFDLSAVINPLEEADEFCHCKSELKYVESGAMGVPMITSRITPYTEFIKEGENGFFASTPNEYAEKLLLLLRDEALSRRVSANSRAYVLRNYDVQENARKFLADVEVEIKKKQQLRVNQHFGWPNIPRKPF